MSLFPASTSRVSTCRVQRRLDSPWPRGLQCMIGGWKRRTFQVRRALSAAEVGSARCWMRTMMHAGHCAPLTWHRPGERGSERAIHGQACRRSAGRIRCHHSPHTNSTLLSLSPHLAASSLSPVCSIHIHYSSNTHTLAIPPPQPASPPLAHIRINHLNRISDHRQTTSILSTCISPAHP